MMLLFSVFAFFVSSFLRGEHELLLTADERFCSAAE